ncbi:MAG: hypothetical protein K6T75_04175 [Acetobacteraceae bacterium]|nr:hypothetical protein [Acetobacteraceae bacterium]
MAIHFLQFGHRDQWFFDTYRDQFDAVTVPGTVASYYPEGTSAFVQALGKPYLIDPRTPVFQAPADGPARPSHVTLAAWHAFPQGSDSVTPADLLLDRPFLEGMVKGVLEGQARYAGRSRPKIEKYQRLLGRRSATSEERLLALLPPYFLLERARDEWECVSRAILASIPKLAPTTPDVWPVLCVSKQLIASGEVLSIHDRLGLGEYPAVVLIVDNLLEELESWRVLNGLAQAIYVWASKGQRVVSLFSGYFSILLTKLGLGGFGHGVGYGDRRRVRARAAGRPQPRYYVGPLHCMMARESAERILRLLSGRLTQCGCPACRGHQEGGVVATGQMPLKDLLVHFLHARHAEIERVNNSSVGQLVSELEETLRAVGDSARYLLGYVRHLEVWSRAFREAAARAGIGYTL